jgi:hypothetical protein
MDRANFALVHESHYLPEAGTLGKPIQIFEVRIMGRGGTPPKVPVTLSDSFELRAMDEANREWVDTFKRMDEVELRRRVAELQGWLEDEITLYRKIGTQEARLAAGQMIYGGAVYAMADPKWTEPAWPGCGS